ncbi:SAM-dependent methyltransferase [soil metagenome]
MANANPTLAQFFRERLREAPNGLLPWAEMMNLALYEPNLGYYRSGVRTIGRSGDFYTSVSVGAVYGEALADFCAGAWRSMECPADFHLIEQGAHDGKLARDILTALKINHPDCFAELHYLIIEPDDTLREAQRLTLGDELSGKLRHIASWQELKPCRGVMLSNELLDAFAVHRIQFTPVDGERQWLEVYVRENEQGELTFVAAPASTEVLQMELDKLGRDFAENYLTEINLAMLDWLREVAQSSFEGPILIVDYGHAAADYYNEERDQGTLRRFYHHHCDNDLLKDLGDADLTADVNFTRLAEEAQLLGMEVREFIEQGRFLTRALGERMAKPGFQITPAWMRQFQTLTHPGHLGLSFQVMVLNKGGHWPINPEEQKATALRRLGLAPSLL